MDIENALDKYHGTCYAWQSNYFCSTYNISIEF